MAQKIMLIAFIIFSFYIEYFLFLSGEATVDVWYFILLTVSLGFKFGAGYWLYQNSKKR